MVKLRGSWGKVLKKAILGLIILGVVSFILLTSIILVASLPDKGKKVDCVIVLGAGLRGGNEPSLVLKARLDMAVKYIKNNYFKTIIVSGGRGAGEDISEAEAMSNYLVGQGVKIESILKEEKSTNTIENLKYSKALYERYSHQKLKKVMIITSNFHMFRAKFLARRIGLSPYGKSSTIPWYIYPKAFVREYFAVIKSFALDKS